MKQPQSAVRVFSRGIVLALMAAMTTAGPVMAMSGPDDPAAWPSSKKPAEANPAEKKPAEAPANKKSLAQEGREVFKTITPGGGPVAHENAWTIVIVAFRGDEADQLSKLALHKVQTEGNLPEAFLERRGEAIVVAYGQYESGDSPRGVAELKRIQSMEVNGKTPFHDALLAPPANGSNLGGMPQINLVQAKALYGEHALYTLQVAVYGRQDLLRPTEDDLKEARRDAERAAMKLRQEGEQAFYYHGPRMSMVTIGVFDEEDFDPQAPTAQSSRLRDARRRFPNNLYNGAGIKVRRPGQAEAHLQASTLVAIPEK